MSHLLEHFKLDFYFCATALPNPASFLLTNISVVMVMNEMTNLWKKNLIGQCIVPVLFELFHTFSH